MIVGNVVLAFAETRRRRDRAGPQGIAFGLSWPAFQSMIASVVPRGAAAALLRRQLHPAQPRHRHRRRRRRLLRRRRAGRAPSRRSTSPTPRATSPRCSSCSVPLRHVAGRVEVDAERRRDAGGLPRRAAQPGDGLADAARLRRPRSSATPSSTPGCRRSPARSARSRPARSGLAFAANTLVIVLLQLVVLHGSRAAGAPA